MVSILIHTFIQLSGLFRTETIFPVHKSVHESVHEYVHESLVIPGYVTMSILPAQRHEVIINIAG